jgi:surfeit locus 1 family protein
MLRRMLSNYRFDWKLSLLLLLLLPLCLRLGFWQLAREQEKLALQQQWMERQTAIAVPLQSLDPGADLQYQQVWLEGRFDNEHVFLLDNRIYQGQVGFEVLQPFRLRDDSIVFVNRGWLQQGASRQDLPQPPLLQELVNLQGSVYVPVGETLTLGDIAPGAGWPKLVQTVDTAQLASLSELATGAEVFPYTVRLGEATPGVLQRNWSVISTTPEKHRGYAVQWFAMATAVLLLYLYYSCNPRSMNPASRNGRASAPGTNHKDNEELQ